MQQKGTGWLGVAADSIEYLLREWCVIVKLKVKFWFRTTVLWITVEIILFYDVCLSHPTLVKILELIGHVQQYFIEYLQST